MRPRLKMKPLAAGLLCALLLFCAAQARAQVTVEAEMGYDGAITYLSAMPLWVRLNNSGADARLTVAVNIDRSPLEYDRYEYPLTLAGGAEVRMALPVTLNYKQAAFTVEVLEDGSPITQTTVRPGRLVAPNTLLVGVLSASPQALSYMNISAANDQLARGDAWQTVALGADTFPDNLEMMQAFCILAVDGVDISTLSDRQQEVLFAWLQQGGVVIVGGGATAISAFRGFSALTGITTMAPHQAKGVEQALVDALADTQFAPAVQTRLQGGVMLSELRGSRQAVAELEGSPLIDRCPVGQGVVYTTAFSLSEKPLSGWSGMTGYWQRVLLGFDQSLYQRIMKRLGNYYDGEEYTPDSWVLRQMPLQNDDPMTGVVLLVAAFVLLGGLGSYLALKRLDKREWMWLTVPLFSLACAGVILGLSRNMQLNKPAAAAYAILSVDQAGRVQSRVLAGVASADNAPLRVSTAAGDRIFPGYDYRYYMDDEEASTPRNSKLRYLYTKGERESITLPAAAAWEVKGLVITPAKSVDCPASGAVWWEEDGLHGRVINSASLPLEAGYIFTGMGYCTVPALQPGEEREFAIVKNSARKSGGIYDGEIVDSRYADAYSLVYAALFPEEGGQSAPTLSTEERAERQRRQSLIQSAMNNWGRYASFHYVTFSDRLGEIDFEINGAPVERVACSAVIDVSLEYRAMSGGLVRLTQGMIPAYAVETGEDGAPAGGGMPVEEYGYFTLREEPVVCFALGEVSGIDLKKLSIAEGSFSCESYGSALRVWLYSPAEQRWEEVHYTSLPLRLNGETIARCLDDAGRLYMRFTQTGSGGEIYSPVLTVEGRME